MRIEPGIELGFQSRVQRVFLDHGQEVREGERLQLGNGLRLVGAAHAVHRPGLELRGLRVVGILGQHEVAYAQRVRPLKQIHDRLFQRADTGRGQVASLAESDDHVGGEDGGARRVSDDLGEGTRLQPLVPAGDEFRNARRRSDGARQRHTVSSIPRTSIADAQSSHPSHGFRARADRRRDGYQEHTRGRGARAEAVSRRQGSAAE